MTETDRDGDTPARTPNIADAIFSDLRMQILKGQLKPGERLMGERELASSYGTNRNTLREAVRKLEQAHLVTVRHGRGVLVSDFRKTGTMELLAPFLQSGPDMRELMRMLEDILVPRVMLIEYATRLAVRRAEPSDVRRLTELSELLITAFESKDTKVVALGFGRWLDALVDAGHSVTVRWIANPFLQALRDLLDSMPTLWILEPSFPGHLRAVVEALDTGDEEAAVRVTNEYYGKVDAQLLTLLHAGMAMSQAGRSRSDDPSEASPNPAARAAAERNGA